MLIRHTQPRYALNVYIPQSARSAHMRRSLYIQSARVLFTPALTFCTIRHAKWLIKASSPGGRIFKTTDQCRSELHTAHFLPLSPHAECMVPRRDWAKIRALMAQSDREASDGLMGGADRISSYQGYEIPSPHRRFIHTAPLPRLHPSYYTVQSWD